MKILHILKSPPDAATAGIIDAQKPGNDVKIVDLTATGISYDALVADVFTYDRIFCW